MICYICVGSNLGDRLGYIKKAVALLKEERKIRVKKISSIYETRPQGGPKGQREYLNLVIKIDSRLSPEKLLGALKRIEEKTGRQPRKKRLSAREIDLDILLCGSRVIRKKHLTVPHRRIAKRYFVLKPLSEIAPNVRHPLTKETAHSMLKALKDNREAK